MDSHTEEKSIFENSSDSKNQPLKDETENIEEKNTDNSEEEEREGEEEEREEEEREEEEQEEEEQEEEEQEREGEVWGGDNLFEEQEIQIPHFGNDIFNVYEPRTCMFCQQNIPGHQYLIHLVQEHPVGFSIVQSMFLPEEFSIEDYYQNMVNTMVDSMIDHMDYGALQNLCDMIGYHKEGIADISTIGTEQLPETIPKDEKCPICMDLLLEKETVYQMKKCPHYFCKECIGTWVSENKTCPVCKADL